MVADEFRACFEFVRKDIRLCAVVNIETGAQTLLMEKLRQIPQENSPSIVDFSQKIDCIHTAVVDVKLIDAIIDDDLDERTLNIRSSEDLTEYYLKPEEKFIAFKSWVAGIAEAGLDAFKIQSQIEKEAKLLYPIVFPLMKFLAKIEPEILIEYINIIEHDCKFMGVQHEPCMIANLGPILDLLLEKSDLSKNLNIKKAIFSINPPLKLFISEKRRLIFLGDPNAVLMDNFKDGFTNPNKSIRKQILLNPKSIDFQEFSNFFSYETERNGEIRRLAAQMSYVIKFPEFKNFLSYTTEPDFRVRREAARNPNIDIKKLPEYNNFFSFKTEPSVEVRKMVARSLSAAKNNLYKNFLSAKTEPNYEVRLIAARNKNALKFKEYVNLKSIKKEPVLEVRAAASVAKNIDIKEKIIVSHDDYYEYSILNAELELKEKFFEEDNAELIEKIEVLKEKLFPQNIEIKGDISREIERLKDIVAKSEQNFNHKLPENRLLKK